MGYVGGVCDRLYNYDSGLLSTTHLKAYVKKYGVTIILLARHWRILIDEFSRRKKRGESETAEGDSTARNAPTPSAPNASVPTATAPLVATAQTVAAAVAPQIVTLSIATSAQNAKKVVAVALKLVLQHLL